jgi:hypothetical protein
MAGGDTFRLIQVTSAGPSPGRSTVVTCSSPEKAAAPGGNRGPRKPQQRGNFRQGSERAPQLEIPTFHQTNLVMRGNNAAVSLTGLSDKRTPVDTRRARVLRDTYARNTR